MSHLTSLLQIYHIYVTMYGKFLKDLTLNGDSLDIKNLSDFLFFLWTDLSFSGFFFLMIFFP